MKKNKKILLSFLALNTILPVYKASASTVTNNYERLYNGMQKNIDNGKSNSNNYKILEKTLNKRNKELKDLYLQNDYIVKPEYLEWQIFFSGTYAQDARTGSISKNKSREGNEDEANWAGKDKPLTQVSGYKEIKIGPSIPYKYLNLQDINPNISLPHIEEVAEINLNKAPLVINLPQLPALPDIQLNTVAATNINDINITKNVQVSPVSVNITAKNFSPINTPNPYLGVNSNGYNHSSNNQNLNTNVDSKMTYTTTLLSGNSQTGLIQIIGPHGTKFGVAGLQPGGTGDMTFEINNNLTTQKTLSRIVLIESHRGNNGSDSIGNQNHVLLVKTNGTLNIDANNSIGVEIEQGYGTIRNDSAYINMGTIQSNKNNVMGIDFKAGPNGPLYAENQGNISLSGDGSVAIKSTNVSGNIKIGIVNASDGIITLSGTGSVGIAAENGDFNPVTVSAGNFTGGNYTTGLRQQGTIDIKGTSNVGMVIKNSGAIFLSNQSLNDSTGNIKLSGSSGVGIYLNYANIFTNNGNISISANSENTGIRVDNGTITNTNTVNSISIIGSATESTGMAATNGSSLGINSGKINITSTGGKNIGLYGIGGNGERIRNSGNITLNLNSGSENIGASIIGAGSIFTNTGTGTITLNDTNSVGKNIGIYSENGTINHSGHINVNAKGNDIGIYLKGNSSGTIGGNINLNSTGNAYDYGVYYDSTYTGNAVIQSIIGLSGKSAGVFSGNKDINFQGTINMINSSDDSIGLLYQGNSTVGNIINNGTINAVKGTGIYFYDGNASSGVTGTVTNSSGRFINVSEGGVGIVAESSGTYSPGKIINIVNNGTISNTTNSPSNSIGIFAKNHDLKITGSGAINVESPGSENLGIYVNGGTVDFESKINVGSRGIGVYLDGKQGNTNESVLNIGGTAGSITSTTNGIGVVAKGEKATVNILSNGITLNDSTSLGVFIDDANISNVGTIETGDTGTAAYLKGVTDARNINLGNLKTGNGGVGLYLEGQNFIDTLTNITTGLNAIGIYSKGGMIDLDTFNSTTFNLGAGSTGYFLENSILKSGSSTSTVNFGDDVTGVALTGSSSIDNSVDSITIGNYSNGTGIAKPIALGIKDISAPLTISTKLTGGNGTVGLYYKTDTTGNLVTYNGRGSLTAPDIKTGLAGGTFSSVGVYLEADSNVNALSLNNTYVRVDGKSGIALGAEKGNISVSGGKIELTEGGVLFLVKDGGSVNISPSTTIITPDSGVELFRVINADYTNSAGTTLEIPRESVAVHGESGVMINEGEMISKVLGGTLAESSIGIYIENTKQTVSGVLDLSNANSKGINRNLINLGNKGIGIFGENSTIENEASGTIRIGNEGAGLYASIGSVLNNNGIIETGANSVGMYAIDRPGSPNYTGITKENYLNNQGQIISSGNNATGISSTGSDVNIKSEIINSGNINLTGDNTVGIYGERTNILNSGNITTGNGFVSGTGIEYAAGIIGNEGNVTIQNGHIQTGNYSIGAAAVGNSSLIINGGTMDTGENSIFNYIKRGTGSGVTLTDTSGGFYTLDKNKQIGIYTEEGDVNSNKTLNVSGTDSMGVYAKNNGNIDMLIQGLSLNIGEGQKGIFVKSSSPGTGKKVTLNNTINLTGNNSLGIIQQEGNIEVNGLINVNSIQSVGILSSNSDIVNESKVLNNSDINVNGELGIGIYGTTVNNAQHEITNTGTINLGNSVSQDRVIMGIYGENGTTINNTGNINVGENSIALYGNNITVNQNGGTLNIAKSGLGVYLNGGTGAVNNTFMNISDGNAAGVYATNFSNITLSSTNVMNIGDTTGALTGNAAGSFGIVGKNNSVINNNGDLNVGLASIGVYVENSTLNNSGNMTIAGTASNTKDGRVLIYGGKSETGNVGSIINNTGSLNAGDMGVGIYSNTGSITNGGEITVGNTYRNPLNSSDRQYAVGIYGTETSSIINNNKITFGSNGLGIYSYIPKGQILNTNLITSTSTNGVGVYIEKGNMVSGVMQEFINDSTGKIILSGDNSIGIAGVDNVKIINNGLVEVTGKNSIGIYADTNSVVENNNIVRATGINGVGISLKNGSILINNGTIDIDLSNGGRAIVTDRAGSTSGTASIAEAVDAGIMSPVDHVGSGPSYDKPSIVNAGIIKVNERFEVPEDAIVQIKVDPDKLIPAEQATSDYHPEDVDGKYLISNSVQFVAKEFVLRNVQVTTDFSQGTNFKKYKLEDVFVPTTPGGGINSGKAAIKSKGLLWDAIPVTNDKGNTDIWMVKKDLSEFGNGLSWGGMADVLDKDYEDAKGDKLTLYDRIDKIETEQDLRRIMTSLSGAHYANRAQRGYDIKKGFDNALDLMENSENNTKENVKVTVIGGAGKTYENKEGVMDYKYQTAGVYALREVERTYAHKFGYSLGYARNSFEIQDSSESEEKVDTLQLGLHNSYEKNGWKYKGSLTGRLNSHDVERNIKWTDMTENLNDRYMSYGVSLDNTLLKEFHLNKALKVSPLISMDFAYQYFDKVKEDYSISSLEIDSNDAYSIKPGVGVRLDTSNDLGSKSSWALKTGFEVKYEYELGESQKQETARIQTFGDKYKLARPVEDKGELKLKAMLGVEVKDRYGIFLTGEYGKAFNETAEDGESYKVGVTLKAVF